MTRVTTVPKQITVQIDTRERYPLFFPANIRIKDPDRPHRILIIPVLTERVKLDIGDYRLKEYPNCCVIERKGSQLELFKNLYNPRDQLRTAKALRRLSSVEYPYLLLEVTPTGLLRKRTLPFTFDPEALVHRLSLIIAKYGLNVIWAGKSHSPSARRDLGLTLVHLMLGYALREITEVPLADINKGLDAPFWETKHKFNTKIDSVVPE